MRELLTGGYDVDIDNKNEDERTPCHLAARHGHVEVLRLILEKDRNAIFDKDEDDNTPLHLAAKAKHSEAVDFLLCQGASVHKRSVELEKELDIAKLITLFTNVGTPNTGRRWTALQRPGHTTAPCCCSTTTPRVSFL